MSLLDPYKYNDGYIFLPLDLDTNGLHQDITLFGEVYYLKQEFHVSLVCVKRILRDHPSLSEGSILEIFNEFTSNTPLVDIEFENEYRIVSHKDGRKSIIQKVSLSYIEGLFDLYREKLDIEVDTQPLHITIYTLRKDNGIGLSTQEEYKKTLEIKFK